MEKLPESTKMGLATMTSTEEKIREMLPTAISLLGAGHAQLAGVDENGNNYLNFSLPLAMREQALPNSIRIEYKDDSGKNKIDWRNCKIILRMQTRNLSQLQIELEIRKGIITCQIATEEEHGMRRVAATKDELRDSLEGAGFTVGAIFAKIMRKDNSVPLAPLSSHSFGFDVKV